LEFKNIILAEKFKNVHEHFFARKVAALHGFRISKRTKFSLPFLNLTILFSNDVVALKEDFSELDISVFLENELGSFQAFLILQI
jgi:hypothetical protein